MAEEEKRQWQRSAMAEANDPEFGVTYLVNGNAATVGDDHSTPAGP